MAAEYHEFESRLRERLCAITEEIAQAKEEGRRAMSDPSNRIGRALAAQQVKIKDAERSRVAAMLAGVQQQQSELLMTTFTSDYINLMRASSKAGSNLSEKQAEAVVSSYQSRLDGAHAVSNLLNDSTEDTLEATDFSGVNFITQEGADDEAYARLFGVEPAVAAAVAAPGQPPAVPLARPPANGAVDPAALGLPSVPGGRPGGHRRTTSVSGLGEGGIGWMLSADGTNDLK